MENDQLTPQITFRNLPQEEKKLKLERMLLKSPNKIPIIFEKHERSRLNCNKADIKFLSDENIKLGFFIEQVRTILTLEKNEALYFSCSEETVLSPDIIIGDLYKKYREEDGYLYIQFTELASFG